MTESTPLASARDRARQVVRERFPEMVGAEPQTIAPALLPLHPADAQRLGLPNVARTIAVAEYTFVFTHEFRTSDGVRMARIARITVDADLQIVKAVVSK